MHAVAVVTMTVEAVVVTAAAAVQGMGVDVH